MCSPILVGGGQKYSQRNFPALRGRGSSLFFPPQRKAAAGYFFSLIICPCLVDNQVGKKGEDSRETSREWSGPDFSDFSSSDSARLSRFVAAIFWVLHGGGGGGLGKDFAR